jgi:hypothetical protein
MPWDDWPPESGGRGKGRDSLSRFSLPNFPERKTAIASRDAGVYFTTNV